MDKKLEDLVNMAMAERFDIALRARKEESASDAEEVERLVALSEQIEHHPGISEDAREILRQFCALDYEYNADCQRYLYIQGAKDCVTVLRELAVIK